MSNPRFSGHETFHCRHFWLKKGFDFIEQGLEFNDPQAVVNLGVGKNMVSSIQHWLNAFNINENNDLSEFSKKGTLSNSSATQNEPNRTRTTHYNTRRPFILRPPSSKNSKRCKITECSQMACESHRNCTTLARTAPGAD
jgi:patatin-like phospholipase/acyl hydrolase